MIFDNFRLFFFFFPRFRCGELTKRPLAFTPDIDRPLNIHRDIPKKPRCLNGLRVQFIVCVTIGIANRYLFVIPLKLGECIPVGNLIEYVTQYQWY